MIVAYLAENASTGHSNHAAACGAKSRQNSAILIAGILDAAIGPRGVGTVSFDRLIAILRQQANRKITNNDQIPKLMKRI